MTCSHVDGIAAACEVHAHACMHARMHTCVGRPAEAWTGMKGVRTALLCVCAVRVCEDRSRAHVLLLAPARTPAPAPARSRPALQSTRPAGTLLRGHAELCSGGGPAAHACMQGIRHAWQASVAAPRALRMGAPDTSFSQQGRRYCARTRTPRPTVSRPTHTHAARPRAPVGPLLSRGRGRAPDNCPCTRTSGAPRAGTQEQHDGRHDGDDRGRRVDPAGVDGLLPLRRPGTLCRAHLVLAVCRRRRTAHGVWRSRHGTRGAAPP